MECPTCRSPNPPDAAACRACGAPLPAGAGPSPQALAAGTPLQGGAFTLGPVLGQGGFGITYFGEDVRLGRAVAIKEFFPQGCARHNLRVHPSALPAAEFAAARERFLEEARILARFHHPGIVAVFNSFEENDTAYMVMEFVRGQSLGAFLEARRALPEAEAVAAIAAAGEALAVVHEGGLLHRDLKPDNILRTDDGRVVLIDFGTAREFGGAITRRMTAMLTPGYAPLEQYSQQARFGPFTDVYALGATLYHLLTGQLPVAALDRVQGVALPSPRELDVDISPATSGAVMWALAMQVRDRPQSVADLLTALREGVRPAAPLADAPRVTPFRFRHGEARSLRELAALVDRYPDEAAGYLRGGELPRWLLTLGEPSLAGRARSLTTSERGRREAMEIFARLLAHAAGLPPNPELSVEPAALDLGDVRRDGDAHALLQVRNRGRGFAWGSVSLHPPLPGLKVSPRFESDGPPVEVRLDARHAPPGAYRGELVLQAEGVTGPLVVPVRYRVPAPWGRALLAVGEATVVGTVAATAARGLLVAFGVPSPTTLSGGGQEQAVAWLLGVAALGAIAVTSGRVRRAAERGGDGARGGRWVALTAAAAFLCCGGSFLALPLGRGLWVSLEGLAGSAPPGLAEPLLVWALAGALWGLLHGLSVALALVGQPRAARSLHWLGVALLVGVGLAAANRAGGGPGVGVP